MKIVLVGDLMLGRGVAEVSLAPEAFWGDTLPLLRSADAVIGNLECALTSSETPWTRTPKVFHFKARPEEVEILRAGNVRCVSLANNHSLDWETQGLVDTLRILDEAGIHHAGAGRNDEEARKPACFSAGGERVAFFALTDNEPPFAAGKGPGVHYAPIGPEAFASLPFSEVEAEHRILSLHWGPNMVLAPPPAFQAFAHGAVERGVDLVHGHSAHLFQGIEPYRKGLILYDTGDFLDDYAVDPVLRNDWSFLFQWEPPELTLVPVSLSFARVDLAKGEEKAAICARMKKLSAGWATFREVPDGLCLERRGG